MKERSFFIIFLIWLLGSLVVLSWYDRVALAALTNFNKEGYFTFEGTKIYPFTYFASALSTLGILYYILREERKWYMLIVGLLVGRASTISAIELYEHIFLALGDIVWKEGVWWQWYPSLDSFSWSLLKISWIFSLTPWFKRKNVRKFFLSIFIYLTLMFLWLIFGFPSVESNNPLAYFFNASSRIILHLSLILVIKR
ncbi:hypothetical protein HRbin06_00364 [archaeon HR06]|nr:hypothetical protein HRbin06_00364 [archaeon HR06]